jgi:predicted Zn-ribbon and HTH transcriptional regulator
MREADRTTRQRIADRLRERALPPGRIAREFDIRAEHALDHVEHIARSIDDGEQLLVAPPACDECGFDGFDDLLNRPSRCPECKAEDVTEPRFRID